MNNKAYSLFANCIFVRGASRAIIMDLQRSDYHIVPDSFIDLFTDNRVINTENLVGVSIIDNEDIHSFLQYLISEDLIFEIENLAELDAYPQLDKQFYYPSKISNLLIDINMHSNHDFDFLINELSFNVGCRHIQFRFFDSIDSSFFSELVAQIDNSNLISVEFILPYNSMDINKVIELFDSTLKIKVIVLSDAPENKVIFERSQITGSVLSVIEVINSPKCCGHIHPTYFAINYQTYFESLNFNNCLNGKLSITVDGNVANCPMMKSKFGHYKKIDISSLVENSEFKRLWALKKDDITKCKDCEFRYICTDCRAFIDNPNDIHSAPLKCGYDPYTNIWEDYSQNPLKQSAIKHYS